MFNELTMTAPSNVVTIDQLKVDNVRLVEMIIKLAAAIKSFFCVECCMKILAIATVLDVVILLFVLSSLTVSGGASLTQIFSM